MANLLDTNYLQEFVENQEKVKIYYSVTCDPANSDMIYSALIVHI